jgi:nucleoside-diphosphate-sugar epimerase
MILLTGATGLAGSFITDEFVRERVPVRILVRNRAKAKGLERAPTLPNMNALAVTLLPDPKRPSRGRRPLQTTRQFSVGP